VAEVVQNQLKRYSVPIDEDRLGKVPLPRVGIETHKHIILEMKEERPTNLLHRTTDVYFAPVSLV
jgi:hypothetical protein